MTTTGRTAVAHLEQVEAPGSMLTKTAAKVLAVLRVSTGFVFLWAFLDKTFGLGYSTPSAKAWINGSVWSSTAHARSRRRNCQMPRAAK